MTRHIIQQTEAAADGRRTAPAATRNTAPLIEALGARLPNSGRVLEIASGTGQHAAAFAQAFAGVTWLPTDVDAHQRASIAAWRRSVDLPNLAAPLELDIARDWPVPPGSVQAVVTINLFHLVPDALVARFFSAARTVLTEAGRVVVYGPFLRGTAFASEGDRAFDAALRARDKSIGYTSVEAVCEMADTADLSHLATDAMPANNLLLTFAAR